MRLVDSEDMGIAQWPHIVVLMAAIPNDEVIKDKAYFTAQLSRKVSMEGKELVFLSQVHHNCNTVLVGLENLEDQPEYLGQCI